MWRVCRLLVVGCGIYACEWAAEVRWPKMSEYTLWSIAAACFIFVGVVELWNKWPVLWKWGQVIMPVPLTPASSEDASTGSRRLDFWGRVDTCFRIAVEIEAGEYDCKKEIFGCARINDLRRELIQGGSSVPPECDQRNIKVWRAYLGGFRQSRPIDYREGWS